MSTDTYNFRYSLKTVGTQHLTDTQASQHVSGDVRKLKLILRQQR